MDTQSLEEERGPPQIRQNEPIRSSLTMMGPKVPDIQFEMLEVDIDCPPDLNEEEEKKADVKYLGHKDLNKIINKLQK